MPGTSLDGFNFFTEAPFDGLEAPFKTNAAGRNEALASTFYRDILPVVAAAAASGPADGKTFRGNVYGTSLGLNSPMSSMFDSTKPRRILPVDPKLNVYDAVERAGAGIPAAEWESGMGNAPPAHIAPFDAKVAVDNNVDPWSGLRMPGEKRTPTSGIVLSGQMTVLPSDSTPASSAPSSASGWVPGVSITGNKGYVSPTGTLYTSDKGHVANYGTSPGQSTSGLKPGQRGYDPDTNSWYLK